MTARHRFAAPAKMSSALLATRTMPMRSQLVPPSQAHCCLTRQHANLRLSMVPLVQYGQCVRGPLSVVQERRWRSVQMVSRHSLRQASTVVGKPVAQLGEPAPTETLARKTATVLHPARVTPTLERAFRAQTGLRMETRQIMIAVAGAPAALGAKRAVKTAIARPTCAIRQVQQRVRAGRAPVATTV